MCRKRLRDLPFRVIRANTLPERPKIWALAGPTILGRKMLALEAWPGFQDLGRIPPRFLRTRRVAARINLDGVARCVTDTRSQGVLQPGVESNPPPNKR